MKLYKSLFIFTLISFFFVRSDVSSAVMPEGCTLDQSTYQFAQQGLIVMPDECQVPKSSCRVAYEDKVRKAERHIRNTYIAGGTLVFSGGTATVVAAATGAGAPVFAVTGPMVVIGAMLIAGAAIAAKVPNRYQMVSDINEDSLIYNRYMRVFLRRARRINPDIGYSDLARMVDESINSNELCHPHGPRRPFAVRRFILDRIRNESSTARPESPAVNDRSRGSERTVDEVDSNPVSLPNRTIHN